MDKEVKIVIGANYGDEGKGLVSYCLAKEAKKAGRKVLNVFYNGGNQRAHTSNGIVRHCIGAGASTGADTYYNKWFVVDPIALWLEDAKVFIHHDCRMVLPCDVVNNRKKELARGTEKHGSCGMGIFEACKRDADPTYSFRINDLQKMSKADLYNKLIRIEKEYGFPNDLVYNNETFIHACEWVRQECRIVNDSMIFSWYDTFIFEGGQGLLLDQIHYNKGENTHLTPSSPGVRNCIEDIHYNIGIAPDLYYVSRGYLTRHGAGEMESECEMDEINPDIVDNTNQPNPWQDSLRFGYLNQEKLHQRVFSDAIELQQATPIGAASVNLVYTQLNYTHGKIASGKGKTDDILLPEFADHVYVSDQKDEMELLQ